MNQLDIDFIVSQNANLKQQNKDLQEENTNLKILLELKKSNEHVQELITGVKELRKQYDS